MKIWDSVYVCVIYQELQCRKDYIVRIPFTFMYSLILLFHQCAIKEYKASGYTVYLLVNSILKVMVHLQMLYGLSSTVLIGTICSDQTNTILVLMKAYHNVV